MGASLPLCYTLSLDTKQTSEVQLLCFSSASLFSRIGQWTGSHSYCTQREREREKETERERHTHMHMWCIQSGSSMEAWVEAAGWTAPQPDVMSPLLFMHLFLSSTELSEPKVSPPASSSSTRPAPPLPSRPPAPLLPPANKGGQIQYGSGEEGKKKRNRGGEVKSGPERTKAKRKAQNVYLTFSSPLSLLRWRFPASLPAWLVKVSAARRRGRPLLADVQLLTLLSPCKREKEAGVWRWGEKGRGGQI